MKIAAITMVYNEPVFLPLWVRYYGNLFGERHLYVIDNDSTDTSFDNIGKISRIRIPRDIFDDFQRSTMISSLHASLRQYYDVVIYTDSDEFLVALPSEFDNLREYVERLDRPFATAIGFDIVQIVEEEPEIDWSKSVLKQRKFGFFNSHMCKTLVSKVSIDWGGGFHASSLFPSIDHKLFLFHLRRTDYATECLRIDVVRNTPRKYHEQGIHQQVSVGELLDVYKRVGRRPRDEASEFEFVNNVSRFLSQQVFIHGRYLCKPQFHGEKLKRIPSHFGSLF